MRSLPWIAVGCFALAIPAAGCWGDVVPIYPDGGVDAATDTGPPEPEIFPGGGTGGGPISGVLNVYFVDEVTGDGIEGAQVMLGNDPETALTGTTDAAGLVVFEDQTLTGTVDLHVLADGYSAESYLGLGAANATFVVRPLDYPTAVPEPATVSGTVSGFDAVPEPGDGEYKVVAVAFGRPVVATLDDRDPLIRPPTDAAVTQVDAATHEFSIQVAPGAGVAYALAGLRTLNDMDQEIYEWTHMGIVTGLEPAPEEVLEGVEIELDIPLLIDFRAHLAVLPSLYTVKEVALALDLHDQGTVWFLSRPAGTQSLFVAPGLDGDLADGGVLLMALGDQDYLPEEQHDLLATTPRARRYEHGLEDFFDYSVGPYIFDSVASPPAQLGWDGAQFTCFPPSGTSLAVVMLLGTDDGVQNWRATVFGSLPDVLPAPAFPESWGWPGVPASGITARTWTAVVDADMNEILFDNFHLLVRDTAENAALIE
jgi:hypothetical protein